MLVKYIYFNGRLIILLKNYMNFYFRIYYCIIILIIISQINTAAQAPVLRKVNGYRARSVYDILIDSKGFLWIASNIGVSRYDGVSFTSYSNPQQSSISVLSLTEDKYGRIWVNNLDGQIFYIQNEQMKLLTGYDFTTEPNFPRLAIFQDKLVATSKKGLFICDLKTLKCHYESCKNSPGKGTRSLSILRDQVMAFGDKSFYIYKPGAGLRLVNLVDADSNLLFENSGTLNVKTYNDTAFLHCGTLKVVYKMIVTNSCVKAVGRIQVTDYINNIQAVSNGYWINTTTCSVKKPETDSVKGYDLNCVTLDKRGNVWYGSLQTGLIRNFESENLFKERCDIGLLNADIVQSLLGSESGLIIGTQNGKLLKYDPVTKKENLLAEIPKEESGIAYLKLLDSNKVLFSSSFHAYIYNPFTKKVEQSFPTKSLKQADTIDDAYILATSAGLFVGARQDKAFDYKRWKVSFFNHYKSLVELREKNNLTWLGEHRTRAVACVPTTKTIWAAFTNGLFEISASGIKQFFFNNLPVYASGLTTYNGKVIVSTFNSGILIIDGGKVNCLSTKDGLLSNIIEKVQKNDNHLWVYNNNDLLQVVDLNTFKVVNDYKLPGVDDMAVISVAEINHRAFLADVNGLYAITKPTVNGNKSAIYLNSLAVNGIDTTATDGMVLQDDQNDVLLNLGIPALLNGRDISVKYRLSNDGPSNWTISKPGDRSFRFSSLMPGKYHFEAFAFKPQLNIESRMLHLDFEILSPWWQRWWAISCWAIIGSLLIFGTSRVYYINLLSIQKAEYEKELAIEKERQRISSDMHDDIGASLSAIKLYTGAIRRSGDFSNGITSIYEMITELSFKIRTVIWSLNKVYDTLESLIHFIDSASCQLFEYSDINLKITIPDEIPEIKINNEKRHDVFLVLREVLHNIIKHSHATDASMKFILQGEWLIVEVADNGIGLTNFHKSKSQGQGLINMRKRVQNLGGKIFIETTKGTAIYIKIPLNRV